MKITLKKVMTSHGDKNTPGIVTIPKWQFVEHPSIYLCTEIERVLGLSNVATGTKLEINIDKFCVTPPEVK